MRRFSNAISTNKIYELAGRYGWRYVFDHIWQCNTKEELEYRRERLKQEEGAKNDQNTCNNDIR